METGKSGNCISFSLRSAVLSSLSETLLELPVPGSCCRLASQRPVAASWAMTAPTPHHHHGMGTAGGMDRNKEDLTLAGLQGEISGPHRGGSHLAEPTGAATVPSWLLAPSTMGCSLRRGRAHRERGMGGCKGTGGSPCAPHLGDCSPNGPPVVREGCACAGVWGSFHPAHLQRNLIPVIAAVSL